MTFSIKDLFATLSITIFSIKTLSIKGLFATLSIKGLFATLSIKTFSINNTQHNSTLSVIMRNVTFYLLLC
jgi:hypothetical protein